MVQLGRSYRLSDTVRHSVRHRFPFYVENRAGDSPRCGGIPENSTNHGTSALWSGNGVQVVAGSNPVAPTKCKWKPGSRFSGRAF